MARVVMRTPKRRKQWIGLPGIILDFNAASTIAGGNLAFAESGSTILRMLGEYIIQPSVDTAHVADDAATIFVALAVLATDVVTAGSTVFPDPSGEEEYKWLYWASHPLYFGDSSLDPNSQAASVRHSFDVRTMRKVGARESLVMVIQYVNDQGLPSILVNVGNTRVLVALP